MTETDIITHVVLVTAVVKKGNKYLVARRSKNDPQSPLVWTFPGGKVEMNMGKDILEDTLKREIMEEVGLEIKNTKLIANWGFIRVSGHHVINLIYVCDYLKGIAKPLEDQEEIKWGTLKELKSLNDKEYYQEVIKGLERYVN